MTTDEKFTKSEREWIGSNLIPALRMKPRTVTESYHAWLIRQRRYCDRCRNTLTPAVTVRNFNGKDLVLCREHASRLDAVRQSDKKQESKIP